MTMTPEEIVDRIARMTDPYKSSDPYDSEETLTRLIRESRRALSPRLRRQQARMYPHERTTFTRAMLRIQDAPTDDVRLFVMEIIDLLWGDGSATSNRKPRQLNFDKEWAGDTIEEVAHALSRRPFYPFPERLAQPLGPRRAPRS